MEGIEELMKAVKAAGYTKLNANDKRYLEDRYRAVMKNKNANFNEVKAAIGKVVSKFKRRKEEEAQEEQYMNNLLKYMKYMNKKKDVDIDARATIAALKKKVKTLERIVAHHRRSLQATAAWCRRSRAPVGTGALHRSVIEGRSPSGSSSRSSSPGYRSRSRSRSGSADPGRWYGLTGGAGHGHGL